MEKMQKTIHGEREREKETEFDFSELK